MVKRKAAKKQQANKTTRAARPTTSMPVPAFAIKILSVILAVILVVALTLYVLGKMPARGFWTLAVILAVIAFGVLPWMRKRFAAPASS